MKDKKSVGKECITLTMLFIGLVWVFRSIMTPFLIVLFGVPFAESIRRYIKKKKDGK